VRVLTEQQREFAEERHGVIYSFLRLQGVDFDEFYDIAIFGFLEAVQQYLEDTALAQRYSFSTIAYRKMFDKIYRARGKEYRRRRLIGDPVSLRLPVFREVKGTEKLCIEDITPSQGPSVYERVEAALVCLDAFRIATPAQLATAKMLAEGYSVKETAEFFGVGLTDISGRMRKLRRSVNEKGGWDIPVGRRPRIEGDVSLRGDHPRAHYKKKKAP
jgi:RNA polymerase sigma-70 factor (ECF subfamily)